MNLYDFWDKIRCVFKKDEDGCRAVNICGSVELSNPPEPPVIGIENSGLGCWMDADGNEFNVEIIRDEEGAFVRYELHGPGGPIETTSLDDYTRCKDPIILGQGCYEAG